MWAISDGKCVAGAVLRFRCGASEGTSVEREFLAWKFLAALLRKAPTGGMGES
jgi:hypothetical protein